MLFLCSQQRKQRSISAYLSQHSWTGGVFLFQVYICEVTPLSNKIASYDVSVVVTSLDVRYMEYNIQIGKSCFLKVFRA